MDVGKILYYLKQMENFGIETFPDGWEYDSWRGSYDELAIEPSNDGPEPIDVLIQRTEDVIDSTFTGYKGGEYRMGIDTPVHIDYHGNYSNGDQAVHWANSIFPDMVDGLFEKTISSDTEGYLIEEVFKRYIKEHREGNE